MQKIEDIAALEALYDAPSHRSLVKVTPVLTPAYRRWIEASRFCVLSTVGPDGTDATPRGDDGPVVRIVDDRTLWLPDWRGTTGWMRCAISWRTGGCRCCSWCRETTPLSG
jgi:predicted pyridoxine 5'-phosphate oxidase superfamily flavin-nucleotide-binding protein